MQPLIHGKFFVSAKKENQAELDSAISAITEHFETLQKNSPAYPPISLGEPELEEHDGLLDYGSTDDFWLYEINTEFWTVLAKKFPILTISLDYGSVAIGENCGTFLSKDGSIVDTKFKDNSPDAVEFSKGINGV